MYLKWAEIQKFSSSQSRQGSITLKPAAIEDAYLHPVASKASEGHILNTYQLQSIEQPLDAAKNLV